MVRLLSVLALVLLLAGCASAATPKVNPSDPTLAASQADWPDEFLWSPEEQHQRELAIKNRDPSMLPDCTDEYFAWREQAKELGLLQDQPPSLDPWSAPGCKGKPDQEVRGPKSGPGPVGLGDAAPEVSAADIAFDMESTYRLGEPVEIAIRNNSNVRYYYQSYYPSCYNLTFFDDSAERRPYPYADPVSEERLLSPGQFIVPQGTHCDLISENPLEPGERAVLFTWDQQVCIKDRWGCVESIAVGPGKYQVRGEFSRVAGVIGPGVDQGAHPEQETSAITAVRWDFIISSPEDGTGQVTTPVPTSPELSGGASQSEEDAAALDYAMATGVDMDEARRRANLLEQLRPTLDAILGEVSDDLLAGLSIEHQPDLHVRLRLTGDPSPALESIIAESPVPIIVSTDVAVSLSESLRGLERARPGLQSMMGINSV